MQWLASGRVCLLLLCAGALWSARAVSGAAEHRIDHIEILDKKYVTIHFDTAPNRNYALQYRTTLNTTNGSVTTGWTNLYVAPAEPFANHYVVADFRTNRFRVYRLRVTP